MLPTTARHTLRHTQPSNKQVHSCTYTVYQPSPHARPLSIRPRYLASQFAIPGICVVLRLSLKPAMHMLVVHGTLPWPA